MLSITNSITPPEGMNGVTKKEPTTVQMDDDTRKYVKNIYEILSEGKGFFDTGKPTQEWNVPEPVKPDNEPDNNDSDSENIMKEFGKDIKETFKETFGEFNDTLKDSTKKVADSVGENTFNAMVGPLQLITQPLEELTGVKMWDMVKSVFKGKDYTGGLDRNSIKKKDPGAAYLGDIFLREKGNKEEEGGIFDKLFGGVGDVLGTAGIMGLANTLFPALMRTLPWVGIAGSLIWATIDGLNAAMKAGDWGTTKVAAFMGGFLAGGENGGLQNAFANAGKWALGLGSAGLLIGGPLGGLAGLLIGGAIGGILGYFGAKNVATGIQDIFDKIKPELGELIGGVIGVVAGIPFGPMGMIVGGLLGTSIGGILSYLNQNRNNMSWQKMMADIVKDPILAPFMGGAVGAAMGAAFGPVGIIAGAILGAALTGLLKNIISNKVVSDQMEKQLKNADVQEVLSSSNPNSDDLKTKSGKNYSEVMSTFDTFVDSFELWKTEDSDVFRALSKEVQEAIRKRYVNKIAKYQELKKALGEAVVKQTDTTSSTPTATQIAVASKEAAVASGDKYMAGAIEQAAIDTLHAQNVDRATSMKEQGTLWKFKSGGLFGRDGWVSVDGNNKEIGEKKSLAEIAKERGWDDETFDFVYNNIDSFKVNNGLHKFHTGGRPYSDIPAIIRRDEEVLSPIQSEHYRNFLNKEIYGMEKDTSIDISTMENFQKESTEYQRQMMIMFDKLNNTLNEVKNNVGNIIQSTNITNRYSPNNVMDSLTTRVE